jgi:hypothetical protein
MNAAQRRKLHRSKHRNGEDTVYLIIRIYDEVVAVTKYIDKRKRIYISEIFFKEKRLIAFHEWTVSDISKAEFETYQEFGIPFVFTNVSREVNLGDLITNLELKPIEGIEGKLYKVTKVKSRPLSACWTVIEDEMDSQDQYHWPL